MSADAVELPPLIPGPSAIGGDFRRFLFLALTMATTDFKLRFYGSVLGYLWQLFRPLLLFGILYAVFTQFIRVGTGVPHYPVVLLENLVLFQYFAEATSAVSSLVDRESLIRKIQFPRLAVPVAAVLTATFNMCLNMLVVLTFALASGVTVKVSWLELPVLLLCLAMLATGLAMLLSSLYVRFRDVRPIWEVIVQLLFYVTPVIYAIDGLGHHLSPTMKHVMVSSPLAAILVQARHAVIGTGPSAAAAIGGWARMPIPIGISLALIACGVIVFKRSAPDLAERL